MHQRLSQALLPSLVAGFVLGLSAPANAVMLTGAEILSDTPEFLNFKFDRFEIGSPYVALPSPGSPYPIFLGQNWNVFLTERSQDFPFAKGISFDVTVEQATQNSGSSQPRAVFAAGTSSFSIYPFEAEPASYLANAPAESFTSVTCPLGSSNCVFYEFRALEGNLRCENCSPSGFREDLLFELKGFFNPSGAQQVPEGDMGIGALGALGIIALARYRQNAFKDAQKS